MVDGLDYYTSVYVTSNVDDYERIKMTFAQCSLTWCVGDYMTNRIGRVE